MVFSRKLILPRRLQDRQRINEMVQAASRVLRASGCYNCRLSLLRAFSSVSDATLFPAFNRPRAQLHLDRKQTRDFSSFPRQLSVPLGVVEDAEAHLIEGSHGEKASGTERSDTLPLPWYLQIDSSSKPPRPLSALQQIPDLPESSPPILEPLLRKISLDLGIDNLSLLDLRHLDPPPALGADLLMIIGTARSEKHLHVSADRFCRWLRSEYKLRPDADGLMGRNELKLKLKRKNKRAKLLGSGTSHDDVDDGVRTGWVCINIGTVDSGTGPGEAYAYQEEFVGFGKQTEGVKVVVQLLVEEKREELDLERLWSGIARRGLQDETGSKEESTSVASSPANAVPNTIAASRVKAHGSTAILSSLTSTSTYSRGFHTVSRRTSSSLDQVSFVKSSPAPTLSKHDQSNDAYAASIQQQVLVRLESENLDAASSLLMAQSTLSMTILQDAKWRRCVLDQLRNYIESMPQEEALLHMGIGYEDRDSTSFIYCFYLMIPRFPSEWEWEYMLWLYSFARRLQHVDYSLEGLSQVFSNLRSSGATISSNMYLDLLRGTLRPYAYVQDSQHYRIDDDQLQLAIEILWDMHDRTGSILTEDVFVTLQENLAHRHGRLPIPLDDLEAARNAAIETYNLPVHKMQYQLDTSNRIAKLMSILRVRLTKDTNRIRLMTIYAQEYHWVFFWNFWRSMARHGDSRSPTLWALMFRLVAETKHQLGCMTVLRTWIPEMDREDPKVRLEGEVLKSVKACLTIADPIDDWERLYDAEARGEWITLWRRCLAKV